MLPSRWPLKSFILIFMIVTNSSLKVVSSFWLTDSSLFQTPIQVVFPQQQQAIIKTQEAQTTTTATKQDGNLSPTTETSNETLARAVESPWIKLDQEQQQQQQCQCNLDWFQNQTNSWLNKWLQSSNVANQMRLLVSNSTGAIGDINRRDSPKLKTTTTTTTNDSSYSNNSSGSSSNHWTPWTRGKGNNEPGRALKGRGAQHNYHHHHQQQQQQQLKLAQGPRGPPGPKGEPGARGDRGDIGPSGVLTRLKNRDALFDLPPPTTTINQDESSSGTGINSSLADSSRSNGKLVFIESEQLLVIGTNIGWRPVQLMPALSDFRKTITKFSLTSQEERRKLLLSQTNNRRLIPTSVKSSHQIGNGLNSPPSSLSILHNRPAAASLYNSAEELDAELGSEDEEDDEEDEEGDEEEGEDDDVDDNGAEEELSEDKELDENDIMRRSGSDERVELDNFKKQQQQQQQTSSGIRRGLRAQEQLSARSSAAAALVSASIENSVTMVSPIKLETGTSPSLMRANRGEQLQGGGERRMRLRLAALNEPFSGNVHGIRGADFECKRNAAKANVKGSFRAFLASGFQNLNEVVRYNVHKYPVVNLRGEILANSWHDLFKQPSRMLNPLSRIYSFDGRHVASDSNWPNKLIWHGASNKAGYRDLIHNCDGWHSDSLSKFGLASPLHPIRANQLGKRRQRKRHSDHQNKSSTNMNDLTSETQQHQMIDTIDKYPCRMPLIVLCIETIGQHSDQSTNKNDVDSSNMLSN